MIKFNRNNANFYASSLNILSQSQTILHNMTLSTITNLHSKFDKNMKCGNIHRSPSRTTYDVHVLFTWDERTVQQLTYILTVQFVERLDGDEIFCVIVLRRFVASVKQSLKKVGSAGFQSYHQTTDSTVTWRNTLWYLRIYSSSSSANKNSVEVAVDINDKFELY